MVKGLTFTVYNPIFKESREEKGFIKHLGKEEMLVNELKCSPFPTMFSMFHGKSVSKKRQAYEIIQSHYGEAKVV